MTPKDLKLKQVYLKPQEAHLAKLPTLVTTVLGSCVAVTMWSGNLKTGGLLHALLPSGGDVGDLKYVDSATRWLYGRLMAIGAEHKSVEVKMFGGAFNLSNQLGNRPELNVGEQNIAVAKKTLKQLNLEISSMDVGGKLGRKLLFYTESGRVLMKYIQERQQIEAATAEIFSKSIFK